MGCHKKEDTTAMPVSGQQEKHCGPWWKSHHQQQHHHHHHHHHVELNGMTWELIPQEKHGHCHRGKWGHHKEVHSEASVKPKSFFHQHHHHHVQLNGMTWELIPEEKHAHCHRGKSWWGHHKEVHSEDSVKPKCFFRSLRDKQNSEKSDKRFDYSENYN